MRGAVVKKAEVVHEDSRRRLVELMNGQLGVRNLKILEVKETSYLGGTDGHWHQYPEVMYIMRGHAKDYKMTNIDTGESEVFDLNEGDVVFRTGRIIHGGTFEAGTIVIDGAGDTYLSGGFNDIPREETNENS